MRLSQLELIALLGAAAVVFWVGCDFIVYNGSPGGAGWSVETATATETGEGGSVAQGGGGGTGPGGAGTGLACCSSCHGTADNPAPPPDFSGKDDPALPTVGAHGTHTGDLLASQWHAPIQCETCHTVPTNCSERQDGDHLNDQRDVVFSGPLVENAVYDDSTNPVRPTCQNTWCHGGALGADLDGQQSYREPVWTDSSGIYGRASACGKACHTLPPKMVAAHGGNPWPHPTQNAFVPCNVCHTTSIAVFDVDEPSFSIWVDNGAYHINGEVNMGEPGGGGPHGGSHAGGGGSGGASGGAGGLGGSG